MGKFNNSNIHQKYSDWHWKMIEKDEKYKRLYVSDIDRIWCEYDFNRKEVIAAIDLKYEYSSDGTTATENAIYDWFISKGVKCYVVFINQDFNRFRVVDIHNGTEKIFDEFEYADWLLSMRGKDYIFPGTPIQQKMNFGV